MVRAFNELRRGDHIGRYVATVAVSDTSVARLGWLPSSLEGCMLAIDASEQRQGRLEMMGALVQLCTDAAIHIVTWHALCDMEDGWPGVLATPRPGRGAQRIRLRQD